MHCTRDDAANKTETLLCRSLGWWLAACTKALRAEENQSRTPVVKWFYEGQALLPLQGQLKLLFFMWEGEGGDIITTSIVSLWEGMVQFSSVAQLCPTLCDPVNRSTPGLPVHHQLPEFTQTHVHRVSDAIQPSHPWSSPSPPAPNPSQHQSLFQWVNSLHEVAKVLEFQLQHHSFQRNPKSSLGGVGILFLSSLRLL